MHSVRVRMNLSPNRCGDGTNSRCICSEPGSALSVFTPTQKAVGPLGNASEAAKPIPLAEVTVCVRSEHPGRLIFAGHFGRAARYHGLSLYV